MWYLIACFFFQSRNVVNQILNSLQSSVLSRSKLQGMIPVWFVLLEMWRNPSNCWLNAVWKWTWIIHHVFAHKQQNFLLILLWFYTTMGFTGCGAQVEILLWQESKRTKLQRQSLELCCCFSPILGVEEETKQKFHIITTDFTCGLISVVAEGFALTACFLFNSLI